MSAMPTFVRSKLLKRRYVTTRVAYGQDEQQVVDQQAELEAGSPMRIDDEDPSGCGGVATEFMNWFWMF